MKKKVLTVIVFWVVLAFSCLYATAGETGSQTASLVLHIEGFDSDQGSARVALVNSKANFSAAIPYKGFIFPINDQRVSETIVGLPYGEYAIKVYHDENNNQLLDRRMFEIPAERYGFSNNVRSVFGPPEFDAAAFKLNSPVKKIAITVQ